MYGWNMNGYRRNVLDQLYLLTGYRKDQLPNLRDFFRGEEIDRILAESVKVRKIFYKNIEPLIDFVISTGYKDEPEVDTDGRLLLHRTTALHHVPYFRRWREDDLVNRLFEIYNRFDVNYVDDGGVSHFHLACEFGCYAAAQQFLESGQDPNCLVPKTGISPLHLALMCNHKKVAELLLNYGADDPNLANKSGSTTLHVICSNKNDDVDFMNNFFQDQRQKKSASKDRRSGQSGSYTIALCSEPRPQEHI
ncbi:unnamed protein product [Trichogramma brassicae]|uniref:Uncharacterized protein n=1 Tax=Trichogramma brassicae TaxID=86971 RepID=A0A6H5J1Z0_9HYME|nr:unnamed protein product [Trichogramma brassicae]